MKFTKEEISLCKQIAEKYKKPIKKGDWIWFIPTKQFIKNAHAYLWEDDDEAESRPTEIPLWTISDCLEFLRGEGYLVRLVEYEHYGGVKTITCYCHGHKTKGAFSKQGNKDEEACLKAVLVVVEEKPHG